MTTSNTEILAALNTLKAAGFTGCLFQSDIVDAPAVRIGKNKTVRAVLSDIYVPSNVNPDTVTEKNRFENAHVANIDHATDTIAAIDGIELVSVNRPAIIYCDKSLNSKLEGVSSIEDAEKILGCKVLYVGQYRQEKGHNPAMLNKIKNVLLKG